MKTPKHYVIGFLLVICSCVHAQENTTVRQAQTKLKAQGYYSGAVDGNSGSGTIAAIKDFQQQNNLPQTGALDEGTQKALGILAQTGVDRREIIAPQNSPVTTPAVSVNLNVPQISLVILLMILVLVPLVGMLSTLIVCYVMLKPYLVTLTRDLEFIKGRIPEIEKPPGVSGRIGKISSPPDNSNPTVTQVAFPEQLTIRLVVDRVTKASGQGEKTATSEETNNSSPALATKVDTSTAPQSFAENADTIETDQEGGEHNVSQPPQTEGPATSEATNNNSPASATEVATAQSPAESADMIEAQPEESELNVNPSEQAEEPVTNEISALLAAEGNTSTSAQGHAYEVQLESDITPLEQPVPSSTSEVVKSTDEVFQNGKIDSPKQSYKDHDFTKLYDAAVRDESRQAEFISTAGAFQVGTKPSSELDQGALVPDGYKPVFERDDVGRLLLVPIDGPVYLLFPSFDPIYPSNEITSSFECKKIQTEQHGLHAGKKVIEPAVCTEIGASRWQLSEKGEIVL